MKAIKTNCKSGKFRLGKKGDLSTTQKAIIAVIVLVVLFVFAGKALGFFSSEGSIRACQASIMKASFLKDASFGLIQNTIKCNDLPDTVIKKSEVMKKGSVNDNAVKMQIAKAMISCNNVVSKGEFDPYKKYAKDQAYCLICSDLIFEEDFAEQMENEGREIKDILYWLATNTVPGKKDTYFKELYGIEPTTELKGVELPIDFKQQYAIVWRLDKLDQSMLGILSRLSAGVLAGSVVGGKIGGVLGTGAGTLVLPVVGSAAGGVAGAVVGSLGGAAAGFIGAYVASEYAYGEEKIKIGSGIFVVPKSQLGEDLILGQEGPDSIKKSFCTKLVNY